MNAPSLIRPVRPLLQKQARLAPSRPIQNALASRASQTRSNASIADKPETPAQQTPAAEGKGPAAATPRLPRAVQAYYLQPLRRVARYGVPSCDLQLRSYSVRSIEFFCDFALRAAYYLGLPAYGPVPLPKITERWTVPKSSFIFKKSQENFERVTYRRLIQIRDGHPETVQILLAFLQKHQHYGVGMKANMWEFSKLGAGKEMDEAAKDAIEALEAEWAHLAEAPKNPTMEKVEQLLTSERFKLSGGR